MHLTIAAFIQLLQNQNRSEHTIKNYQRDLQQFVRFWFEYVACLPAGEVSEVASFDKWSEISASHIKSYLAMRSQHKIHPKTLARELSSLRSALNFFVEQGVIYKNVAKSVKAPKVPQSLPKSLDVDQTAQLLSVVETAQSFEDASVVWQEIRDQAIFELLYSAGLRVSECASLDAKPVAQMLVEGWVCVLGKGNKERMAPVGAKAKYALIDWLKIRSNHAQTDESALFVNRFGGRLSVRSIQMRLDKRAAEVGLPTKMSPHRLRHACATHVLESSGDLRAVQEMLGHANLSTTQIYTKLDLQHLAKVYDGAHPRAKKK